MELFTSEHFESHDTLETTETLWEDKPRRTNSAIE